MKENGRKESKFKDGRKEESYGGREGRRKYVHQYTYFNTVDSTIALARI